MDVCVYIAVNEKLVKQIMQKLIISSNPAGNDYKILRNTLDRRTHIVMCVKGDHTHLIVLCCANSNQNSFIVDGS